RWADRLDEVFGAPPDVALRLAAELDASAWEWRRASRAPQGQERGRERGQEPGDERGDDPLGFAIASWQLHLRRRMLDESRPAAQARWARLIERSFVTLGYLEQNVSPRLALECFLLEATRAA
ncbi:MAG: hypothetical protein J2P39_09845, partial [Candidatus Dormibacteraeota bacterium]|nr:hypothetical protein [Candidatus Dormibacteraeota bacterium]